MSQDDQNRNPQDDGQGQKEQQVSDDMTREARTGESEPEPLQGGTGSPDVTPAADDLDDTDEDRDEDSRDDGSPNRRSNIG